MEAEQRTPAELDLDLERYGLLDEGPLDHRSAGRLVDQAVDRLVPLEGLEQGQGALAVPLDDRAGARDGGRRRPGRWSRMPPPPLMSRIANGNRTRFQTWAAWSTATASVPRRSRGRCGRG